MVLSGKVDSTEIKTLNIERILFDVNAILTLFITCLFTIKCIFDMSKKIRKYRLKKIGPRSQGFGKLKKICALLTLF